MPGNKQIFRTYLDAFVHPDADRQARAVEAFFSKDATISVVHPFNAISGGEAYLETFLSSLRASFDGLYCRDYLLMSGVFEGGDWVSSTGYYAGHFRQDWLGIRPTNALAYLRVGEFHRLENGRAVESYVFLDIPELMIAASQWPITDSPGRDRGYTGFLPGPASQDGLMVAEQDAAQSQRSYQLVTDMLSGLATEDEAWRPYWHDNMVWYGPAAFGSFIGIENFAGFQVTFENAFEDWAGGSSGKGRTRHFVRHGDGNYACSGGWPSLSGVQIKPYLGQPATNKMLYMRVCDWWRRENDLLVENWVFVDIPHVLMQMGYDLFDELDRQA
ncbi:MAG: ester cyclase, partial [Hyphomicrobiales bacterium]|nr:ester cyclase [Hyphomicrobiales bacterium]